jgi:hypothetical protein
MPKPSIYITGIKNISPLIHLLEQRAKQQYEIKAFADNQVKVQPKISECYGTTVKTDYEHPKAEDDLTQQHRNLTNCSIATKMTAFLQSVTPTESTDYERVSIMSGTSAAIYTAVVIVQCNVKFIFSSPVILFICNLY